MTRTLPFVALVAVLAALAAITPGPPAPTMPPSRPRSRSGLRYHARRRQTLGTLISANTSSTKALASLQSFTKTARQGAAAISTTKPSTKNGPSSSCSPSARSSTSATPARC